jgi:hypothetical protein
MSECGSKMKSKDRPGHTHLCRTAPHEGFHICRECKTIFGVAG